MVYCNEKRDVKVLNNGFSFTSNLESLWLEMTLPNSKPTRICSVYGPPDSKLENSLHELQSQYETLEVSRRQDVIIIGDINVDHEKASSNKTNLCSFMKVLKIEQLMITPTRVTETTSTLIDHIWCNNPTLYVHRGVGETGLSDHSLIFCCRKYDH